MTTIKHWCDDCTGHNDWGGRYGDRDEVMAEGLHTFFANGYGLSIQRNGSTYSDEETFEVAVLHRHKRDIANDDWHLCYRTPVTEDVLAYQTGEDLVKLFAVVSELRENIYCSHHRSVL